MDLSGIEKLTEALFKAQGDVLTAIKDPTEKEQVQSLINDLNKSIGDFENVNPEELMRKATEQAQKIYAKKD